MTSRHPLRSLSANVAPVAPSSTSSNVKIPAMDTTSAEDSTQDSAISGLSILDDEQDSFYKRTLSHVRQQSNSSRDRQRLHNAIGGAGMHAFSKSRPRARMALTMENLERNHSAPEEVMTLHKHQESARGSSEQEPSTPDESERSSSPNVPRQWGRKGRQKNDFLKRLSSTTAAEPLAEAVDDPDALFTRRRRGYTGDSIDEGPGWVPSPVLDDTAQTETTQDEAQKLDLVPRASRRAIDDILELEQDHSAVESPSSSRSNRRRLSNTMRRREIDEVERRAIATGRLAEAGARRRSLRKPRSSPQGLRETANVNVWGNVTNLPGHERDTIGRSKSTAAAETPRLPTISRRDLLRQLSRTPSATPSPDPEQRDMSTNHSKSEQTVGQTDHRLPTPPDDDDSLEALEARSPLVNSAHVNAPAEKSTDRIYSNNALNRKEPHTSIALEEDLNLPKSALQALLQRTRSRPAKANPSNHLPTFEANQNQLATSEANQNSPPDDTTQVSLTSLVSENATFDFDDDTRDLISNVSSPVPRVRSTSTTSTSASNKETRKEEAKILAKLSRTLKNAYRSFRDLSKGMKKMEQTVEASASAPAPASASASASAPAPASASAPAPASASAPAPASASAPAPASVPAAPPPSLPSEQSSNTRQTATLATCPHCHQHITIPASAPTLGAILYATFLSLLSYFYRPSTKYRRARLTLLGILTLTLIIFFFVETSLCDAYCHPRYATLTSWSGFDLDAPEMPFVTLTLIGRPLKPLWEPLLPVWYFFEDLFGALLIAARWCIGWKDTTQYINVPGWENTPVMPWRPGLSPGSNIREKLASVRQPNPWTRGRVYRGPPMGGRFESGGWGFG